MPGFMDLAKEGFEAYQAMQAKQQQQGQQQSGQGASSSDYEQQSGGYSQQAGAHPSGGGYGGRPQGGGAYGQGGQPQNSGSGTAQEYYNEASGQGQGYGRQDYQSGQQYQGGPGSQGYGGNQGPGPGQQYGGGQSYGGNSYSGQGYGNQGQDQGYGASLTPANDVYNHPAGHVNHDQAIAAASQSAGGNHGGMFAQALQHATTPGSVTPSLDHQSVENAHTQAYQGGNAGSLDAHSMGSAAAMQAIKKFTGGGGSGGAAAGGGGSQTELISMAMSEAVKLFDKSGGAASGNKQEVITSAAQTVMKLVLQSKMGAGAGAGAGGAGQGQGLSQLMGIASKFL